MKQIGIVTNIIGNLATIDIARPNGCGENCATCKATCENQTISGEALNKIHAGIGDKVVVYTDTSRILLQAFLVYLLPLISFIITLFLAQSLMLFQTIILSVGEIIIYILLLRVFERKNANGKNYLGEIVGII
jgi:sigma-E factor negative regulatory protein RseC